MVTFESDGSLTFRVYLPNADTVALVADFTEWQRRAVPLTRESPDPDHENAGWWTANVKACDGDHAFSYLVDEQWWLPDYAAHGVRRNEQGSWTSLLFVPPPPRLVTRIKRRSRFEVTVEDPMGCETVSESRLEIMIRSERESAPAKQSA
jgi:1,4-alpha-glucan branching enzyme